MSFKIFTTFLLIITSWFFATKGRTGDLDSLQSELKLETNDTIKALLKYKIGEKTYLFRIGYWDSLIVELHKFQLYDEEASSINNLGMIHDQLGHTEIAIECHNRSFAVHKRIGNIKGMSYSLNNIGMIYDRQGLIEKALEVYFESLRLKDQIGDEEGAAYTLNNIGILYKNQNDFDEALSYFFKSLEIRNKFGKPREIAFCKNNIGIIYAELGNLEEAVKYLEGALALREAANDLHGIAITHNSLAETFAKLNDSKMALSHFQSGLMVSSQAKYKYGITLITINLGTFLLNIEQLEDARDNAIIGLKLANELKFPDLIKSASFLSYNIDRKNNDFKNALTHYENYIEMRDSINNEKTQKATIRQQTKYEFEKEQLLKEQKLKEESRKLKEETERRDNIQYSIIFIVILVVFGTILSLGFIKISPKFAEGLIFFAFLIFFEFCLVLLDPYIDKYSGGEPAYKLLFNAVLAGAIFPIHAFFENRLKKQLLAK